MKQLLFFFLLTWFSVRLAAGQSNENSTEEMLHAKRVTDFVVIKVDPESKVIEYQLDDDAKSRRFKQYLGKLCLGVSEKGDTKQLRVELAFLNPFKYRVTLSDTLLRDPSYESVGKMLALIESFSGQLVQGGGAFLGALPQSVVQKKADVANAQLAQAKIITKPPKDSLKAVQQANKVTVALKQLDSLNAPALSTWLFLVQSDEQRAIWLDDNKRVRPKSLLKALKLYSTHYYQSAKASDSILFVKQVEAALTEVSEALTYEELQSAQKQFDKRIKALAAFNEQGKTLYKSLDNALLGTMPGESASDSATSIAFARYSRDTFGEVLTQGQGVQQVRDSIVHVLQRLSGELKSIRKKTDNTNRSYLLARMLVSDEQMREFTLRVQPRTIRMSDGGIVVESGATIASSQIRVRANKKVIPEFGTGAFFTNLEYPRYGTKIVNGETFVAPAEPTKYRGVVAAHLNLVLNTWEGFIHPMMQVGVGTAKETPSLLAGGGLRFTGSARLALTGGALWTWRRELNKLNVGDKIDGTAQLESDLKLTLRATPSFYIGLQREF